MAAVGAAGRKRRPKGQMRRRARNAISCQDALMRARQPQRHERRKTAAAGVDDVAVAGADGTGAAAFHCQRQCLRSEAAAAGAAARRERRARQAGTAAAARSSRGAAPQLLRKKSFAHAVTSSNHRAGTSAAAAQWGSEKSVARSPAEYEGKDTAARAAAVDTKQQSLGRSSLAWSRIVAERYRGARMQQ